MVAGKLNGLEIFLLLDSGANCGRRIHLTQRRVKDMHLRSGSDATAAGKLEWTGTRRGSEELSRPRNPGCEFFRLVCEGGQLANSEDDHDGRFLSRGLLVTEPVKTTEETRIGPGRVRTLPGGRGGVLTAGFTWDERISSNTGSRRQGPDTEKSASSPPSAITKSRDGPTYSGDVAIGNAMELAGSPGAEEGWFTPILRRLSQAEYGDAQPIPQCDREKTAFSTLLGLFQSRVMPFDLCNAPATFQLLMETALRELTWKTCLVYLEDIIVFGRTEEEHLEEQLLEEVLSRLRAMGLKVKPRKCQLMSQSVRYLGHIVTQHGIGTDQTKKTASEQWPVPQCHQNLTVDWEHVSAICRI
ncbi:Retrovirus-related Pol polyprotein from transposon 17.6 [Trichinella pseudospiralis]|uniref:Retrovirus-related Pol polyprotein from transposon 17.6 n=2 Tax=Trichinella pseudospiralis TaxID=6337 RepID=A0A0V1JJ73_TRIPS|nr:Retrovirus-related Pol polyprotein from transposon 17.6 [Trichinella pseudospiralis]KRZ44160.1 Retrovirus-related Pol polyprotein from transposon 17.6 [Trichinella pseudospiralis]